MGEQFETGEADMAFRRVGREVALLRPVPGIGEAPADGAERVAEMDVERPIQACVLVR